MIQTIIILGTVIGLALSSWSLLSKSDEARQPLPLQDESSTISSSSQDLIPSSSILPSAPDVSPSPLALSSSSPSLDVPFTAQAPVGNWEDELYQNACEEASILMAMRWVEGKQSLTTEEALLEIKALSEHAEKNYGHFHDLSTADTAQLIKDYFGYDGIEVKVDISLEDIIAALTKGNVVIVPANGEILANPFYVPPGPVEHMLVVKGYDAETRQFITNDPGTKEGNSFRYSDHVLFAAIRDYPTGYHEPIGEEKKVMIVVRPQSA